MKTLQTLTLVLAICFSSTTNAQFLKKLKQKAQEAAERTVERKVEEKTERETEKGFDSIFNNQGGIFKGEKAEPAVSYAFTHAYEMDIISGKDTTNVIYYLTNVEEFMGSAIQLKENEKMITVIDLPRKTTYNFMDFGESKSMMSFGMDFEKMVEKNANGEDVTIEATGNTKEILGFNAEEYRVVGKDFNGTIWVTQEAEISFSDAFTASAKGKNNANQAWMSMVEGLTLEMHMTDTKKKKPKHIKMLCTAVNPTDYTIYSSDYEKTF